MKPWNTLTYYAGFDWAADHHDVVTVNTTGTVVAEFRFAHSAEGWEEYRKKTAVHPALGVALETCSGAAVEELLRSEHGVSRATEGRGVLPRTQGPQRSEERSTRRLGVTHVILSCWLLCIQIDSRGLFFMNRRWLIVTMNFSVAFPCSDIRLAACTPASQWAIIRF